MPATHFSSGRRSICALLALTIAFAPIVHAQLVLPDLGDPAQLALSVPQERRLGESIMRDVRMSGGYLNDPEVSDYLNQLGNRLVVAIPGAPFDFEFFAVNDSSINAFALPGGFVGINTGLILLTQTESELAAVLAHEISHVTQHHIARTIASQKDAMLATLAALAGAILAARTGGSSSGQIAQAAAAGAQGLALQMQINFTRQNEQEADRVGFTRLEAAGFDVYAMATFMERLQRSTRFLEGNVPSYLRDHPVTYERIADAQARAQGKPFRLVKDSLDFSLVRALVRSYEGTAKDAFVLEDALVEKRYNDAIAARYGLVAALVRADNLKRAQVELATLQKVAPPHPMIEAMAGQVLVRSTFLTRGDRALRIGVGALSGQDATDLRLSGSSVEEQSTGKGHSVPFGSIGTLPVRRTAASACRSRLRGARQTDAGTPAPGRVLRLAGQSAGRHRPVRDGDQIQGRRLLPVVGRGNSHSCVEAGTERGKEKTG